MMLTYIVLMTNSNCSQMLILLAHTIKAMLQETCRLIFGHETSAFFKANAQTSVYCRQIPSHTYDLF